MTLQIPTATVAPVRVDVWSDFVCPYCLIGSLRLDQLAERQPIETVWHAFMLRPPDGPGMTAEKRAMIEAYTPKISAQIRDEFGLDMRRGPIGAQTFAAHHAMKHAERSGQGALFHDAVLRAYWLFFGIILAVLAHLLWPRGTDLGVRLRVRRAGRVSCGAGGRGSLARRRSRERYDQQ